MSFRRLDAGTINGKAISQYPEAQGFLLTPDALVAMSKGSLNDSMWAEKNVQTRKKAFDSQGVTVPTYLHPQGDIQQNITVSVETSSSKTLGSVEMDPTLKTPSSIKGQSSSLESSVQDSMAKKDAASAPIRSNTKGNVSLVTDFSAFLSRKKVFNTGAYGKKSNFAVEVSDALPELPGDSILPVNTENVTSVSSHQSTTYPLQHTQVTVTSTAAVNGEENFSQTEDCAKIITDGDSPGDNTNSQAPKVEINNAANSPHAQTQEPKEVLGLSTGQHDTVSPTRDDQCSSQPVITAAHCKIEDGCWGLDHRAMPKLTPDLILQEIDERRRLGKGDLLTREALGSKTGEASRVWSVNSLEDRVSDTIDAPKEVIRVKQGRPAAELLADWNGWMPPVADWEHDRLGYDDTYKYQYVPEWTKHTPSGEHCAVNTTSNAFSQGFPISNKAIMKIRYNHDTIPDLGACENESARCHQTTAMEVFKFNARAAGQRKNAKHRYSRVTAQNKEDTDNAAPASFPHLIALYLRPASLRDAAEMAKIYNFYVENSTMTEDQVAVDVKDMEAMMKKCHASHTPVIVAVLGTAPQAITAHGDETVTVTQYEKAIGFAFARFSEQTGRQLGNKTTTRSSGIAHVQIFVSSQYTRHGIGRCLLDRVLQTLSHAYDANNGYPWVDPHGYSVHEKNRAPHCRQVIIEIPKTRQHDPEFEWKKQWLEKFSTLIKHVATIPSACYAKAQDSDTAPAELDLAIFSLNFGKKCNAVVKDEMDG